MSGYITDKNLLTEEELAEEEVPNAYISDGSPSENEDEDVYESKVAKYVKERQAVNRLKQKRTFTAFVEKKVKDGIKKEMRKQAEEDGEPIDPIKREEQLTIMDLLPQGTRNIADPRKYQLELFERAMNENVIAVLDTGSGKTLIACMLIRHIIDKETQDRASGKEPRSSFFLTDNVTLAIQQWNVLRSNLDTKVGLFHGHADGQISKRDWVAALRDHLIIVMTSDYLLNCLTHGFIRMHNINLICFDEAHRAKKNHSYARIIHDFYKCVPVEKQPKIFGMTASPVDAQVDVIERSLELEQILNARIATARNLDDLRYVVRKPMENVVRYEKNFVPWQPTELFQQIQASFGSAKFFEKMLFRVKALHNELGPWCADQAWASVITDKLVAKIVAKQQMEGMPEEIARLEEEIRALKAAKEFVASRNRITPPNLMTDSVDISPKVRCLMFTLADMFAKEPTGKCIVFVNKRNTARVLTLLIKHNNQMPPGIFAETLTGQGATFTGEETVTIKQQMLIVSKFRRGRVNCLIATSVAEEGLDIPDCSRIIRFDLYTTMIQYVQSRGRARHAASEYIHMMEMNNSDHMDALRRVKLAENQMRRFCEGLPEDRMLKGKGIDPELDWDGTMDLFYEEPSTGAKLTPHSAMSVLNHYTGAITAGAQVNPEYDIYPQRGGYVCAIRLPEQSPVRRVKGNLARSRNAARRDAAYEACLKLRKVDELNANLMPVYVKAIPEGANALLAVSETKKNSYPFQLTPEVWTEVKKDTPTELYGIIVDFVPRHGLIPYMFLSPRKMPHMPSVKIFLDDLTEVEMRSTLLEQPIQLRDHHGLLELLTHFNYKFYEDNFGKFFDHSDTLPFWCVPILVSRYSPSTRIDDILDWDTLKVTKEVEELSLGDDRALDFSRGRVFIDRFIGIRRRYYVTGRAPPEVTQSSPVVGGKNNKGFEMNVFLLSHDVKSAKEAEALNELLMQPGQLVVEGRTMSQHLILIKPPPLGKVRQNAPTTYIVPSHFRISPIPADFCESTRTFPSFVHKLNTYIHAETVFDKLDTKVTPVSGLEAITKGEDATNGAEVQDSIAMGRNYERLEFLGDCFLKLATTLCQFVLHHGDSEYELHVKRMGLLCNKNLYEQAIRLDIPRYIQATPMTRHGWYPRLRQAENVRQKTIRLDNLSQRFNDKSIADVCEAIIGAALYDNGLDSATKVTHYLLNTDEHKMVAFEDYYKHYVKPPYQTANASASIIELCRQLEVEVGYKFKYPKLAQCAFTHPSNPNLNWDFTPNYQRIEFLGDALLDLAIIEYLFKLNPDAGPQWLTEHKMAMVSNKFLAVLCVLMGLHKHLRYSGGALMGQISAFVDDVFDTKAEAQEKGEGVNWWMGIKESPPKALSDVIESIVGAMFIDSEFDYQTTVRFFESYVKPFFENMSLYDTYANQHPTTAFSTIMSEFKCENYGIKQAVLPSENEEDPNIQEPPQILCAIMVHGEVLSYCIAPSIKAGRVKACEKAIAALRGVDHATFVQRFCDCHVEKAEIERLRAEDDKEKKRLKSAVRDH